MLPDLRIVIVAVISTFAVTAGVGFYMSARLMSEPNKHAESLAAREETPVSRIALSWPAPLQQQPDPLALDFAVTARALRNPVRDVTNEAPDAQQRLPSPVKETAVEPVREVGLPAARTDHTALAEPAVPAERAPAEPIEPPVSAPVVDLKPTPQVQPEVTIRVDVQYPPVLEFPAELKTPAASISTEPPVESPVNTGSIAATPAEPPAAAPEEAPQVASRPEPEAAAGTPRQVELPELPKPAPKVTRKKAAPKKAVPTKSAKRPARTVRRRPVATRPAVTWPFGFFGQNLN